MAKQRYLKITYPDGSGFIAEEIDQSMFDHLEPEDEPSTIEVVEMTERAYKKLPEYEGF